MIKPANFHDLPANVAESLLRDMELDYDSYESSRAETIHAIMCGDIDSTNELIIKNYYKALSVESLKNTVEMVRDHAHLTLMRCNTLLNDDYLLDPTP